MIRPTVPADTPILVSMTERTGLFLPIDLEALHEVLDDYHEVHAQEGHRCVTDERDGKIVGFAYFAPTAMTDRTWYLWWIVVSKDVQAKGIGGEMLKFAENEARKENGRIFFVETSGLDSYQLTRNFYAKNQYGVAGVLKDYYADGHDMYVYSKRL